MVPQAPRAYPHVVTYEHWIDNEMSYLRDVYETLQELNRRTGRAVFDEMTCPFHVFCRVAYEHSFKYNRVDEYMYMGDSEEEA